MRAQADQMDYQIRALERQQQNSDETKRRVAIQEELRALDAGNSIALIRIRLTTLDSTKVEDLQAELDQLDAAKRLPALETRVEQARLSLISILDASKPSLR
jgi:hypothetical protein